MSNKETGDIGEQEVCDLVGCPNCSSKLMLLPPSFPLAASYVVGVNLELKLKPLVINRQTLYSEQDMIFMKKFLKQVIYYRHYSQILNGWIRMA